MSIVTNAFQYDNDYNHDQLCNISHCLIMVIESTIKLTKIYNFNLVLCMHMASFCQLQDAKCYMKKYFIILISKIKFII
jgi:hypothetical protein